jgi:hypothetical protein
MNSPPEMHVTMSAFQDLKNETALAVCQLVPHPGLAGLHT